MKVGGKQNPYEMWQAGISLAASPLAKSLAGPQGIWRLRRHSPAHESRQLRRLRKNLHVMFGKMTVQCRHGGLMVSLPVPGFEAGQGLYILLYIWARQLKCI